MAGLVPPVAVSPFTPGSVWVTSSTTELGVSISERGFDYGLNKRMERQLGIKESKTAELFGDAVIADVALIGTDTFLRERRDRCPVRS